MLTAFQLLLRENRRGVLRLRVTPEHLIRSRQAYPLGNGEYRYRNPGRFFTWRPDTTRSRDPDFRVWAFGLGNEDDFESLMKGLRRREVWCMAEALRAAGYTVESTDAAFVATV
jgi:hypothetical protein